MARTRQGTEALFRKVVRAFVGDARVTQGGKGFGSTGLKVDGKLFALISSKGKFVVKLPKERVRELVDQGLGDYFDPGHGRLMREWVALDDPTGDSLALAREARRFVAGDAR